ncbi:MAG: class I SAM-dependent methyltransferase [Candidatus Rokuibacteriota bacterium]
MTRFMLLDRGEELSEANWRALASHGVRLRLKLLDPAAPLRDGQVVQVVPLGEGARSAGLCLHREGGAFSIRPHRDDGEGPPGEVLARVVAIERGRTVISLERGLFAHLPARWLPGAVDALEVLGRFRRPFSPPLYVGTAEACLAGVREKYNGRAEARQYSSLALTGLEAFERELVEQHVKPGGRLLDIGCGGGREALGLARAGFRVVGIDIAPAMIEAARANAAREGLAVTFRAQSATELDEPPGSFDGAFWGGSYQHVPGRALRVETLRGIRRALTPDGVLILGVVAYRGPRPFLSRSRLVDFFRNVAARLWRTRPVSEPGDGYMREVSDASDPREPCFFHDFAGPGEVEAELEAARFNAAEVTPDWWVCRPALPD